jgi:septum formation inhibitor MinC
MAEHEAAPASIDSHFGQGRSGGGGLAVRTTDPSVDVNLNDWKTSLLPPPVPNPDIYGLDKNEVTIPSSMNAMVGMSNVVSAQTGAPPMTRADHMRAADGGRAHAMRNQLLIAARNIEALTVRIDDTIRLANTKSDERSVDGYVQQLEGIVALGEKERGKIVMVTKEKFADPTVRDGAEHIDRAVDQFKHAIERAKAFAKQNGASYDHAAHNADGELNNVAQLLHELKMTGVSTTHVKTVKESENELQQESLSRSLDGLDHSTRALVLALREPNAANAMAAVLPGLLSNARMLEASMAGSKASNPQRKTGAKILEAMKDAMLDARGLGLDKDPGLLNANVNVSGAIQTLLELPRAKK